MKAWIPGALSLGTAMLIASACVLVEDFQGYGPLGNGSACDKPPCPGTGGNGASTSSSSSSGESNTTSSSSSSISSSGSGGAGGSPVLSSSSSSSSSSGLPANVACGIGKCPVEQGVQGCCYNAAMNMKCSAPNDCNGPIMFYCDGREDCGGGLCCVDNTEATCNASCPSALYACLDDMDCPPATMCMPNVYGTIGLCSPP